MLTLALGLGLTAVQNVVPSDTPQPVLGDPITLTIRDATPLNYFDGAGCVADVEFLGMGVGGVGDQSGDKALVLVVRGAGYTASRSPTTYDRVIYGTLPARKPAPLQAEQSQRASGSNAIISFVLDDFVHQGEEVVSASIGAGAYVRSAVSSNAATNIPVRTNSSTLAVPAPAARWNTLPLLAPTGTHFRVEANVCHPFGRGLRMAAAVEFRVLDKAGVDQGISVVSSAMEVSTQVTGGNPVPVFAGSIPQASLTQGTAYRVRMLVYGWLGETILDSEAGFSAPMADARFASLPFVCDKAGTYGDQVAFVKVGVSGGTVGNKADLAAARATPFPTTAAAAAALRIANNAKAGADKRDCANGSRIYLMETSSGAGADHAGLGANTMLASTTGYESWLEIAVDPAATGLVRLVTGAQKNPGNAVRWMGVKLAKAAVLANDNDWILLNAGTSFTGYNPMAFTDGCEYVADAVKNVLPFNAFGLIYAQNSTFSNVGNKLFAGSGGNRTQWAYIAGCNVYGPSVQIQPQVLVGNIFHDGAETKDANSDGNVLRDANDGFFEGYNSYRRQTVTRAAGVKLTLSRPSASVQNLVEVITNGNNAAASNFGADRSEVDGKNHYRMYNTEVGDRSNRGYTASEINVATVKRATDRWELLYRLNKKGDAFRVTNDGQPNGNDRFGNMSYRYAVSCFGVVVTNGASGGGSTPSYSSWLGETMGRGGITNAAVTFANPQQLGFGTSLGGGDYHLTGETNDAYGRVPAGLASLPFDLGGAARRNDGSGAAGCYERTV